MDIIESTFSGTPGRVENDEEAQRRAMEQAQHRVEDQPEAVKRTKIDETIKDREKQKDHAPINKEASDSAFVQARNTTSGHVSQENGSSGEEDGDTPRRLPIVKAEKAPEIPFRPPVTPRKNVIPSRRAGFDNVRTTSAPKGNTNPVDNVQAARLNKPSAPGEATLPGEQAAKAAAATLPGETQATKSDKPPAPAVTPGEAPAIEAPATRLDEQAATTNANETPALEAEEILNTREIEPDSAHLAARSDSLTDNANAFPGEQAAELSTNSADVFLSNQLSDLPLANLAATYHDTSAAEEAWQAADLSNELNQLAEQDTHILAAAPQTRPADDQQEGRQSTAEMKQRETVAAIITTKMATPVTPLPTEPASVLDIPTTPMPVLAPIKPLETARSPLTRKKALLMVVLLAILLLNATAAGFSQSFGSQGWASKWDGSGNPGQNLLTQIAQRLQHSPTPNNGKATPTPPTPTQIVNLLMSSMTLDEKLGQMMMVQFTGPDYSPQLDAMISQYKIGSVLVFTANGNIVSKTQLTGLISQMQKNAFLPLAVSIDQEGGTVDRLINLDGAQPAAATIGATNNPHNAYQQGIKDAQNLASYGFNLNLAPVVDVTNVYNPQLYGRTYGNNPAIVTSMAGSYLQGLQKSGKVIGTLKHFPGLGDVSVDPHFRPPDLARSLNDLNSIDWAPYSNLIKQGNVYAIMVTHEYVKALDTTEPSSLSPKVVGVLRNQMHFQGVIMTDSLTMDSISNYYSYGQAAAMAVEAGEDLLMGASSPNDLAQMLAGIKQAVASGAISQQRIDDSVRRILLLKYEMGLIHV